MGLSKTCGPIYIDVRCHFTLIDKFMDHAQRDGALLVFISAAGYACFPLFSKAAFDSGLSPLDLLEWRFLIATPLVWLLLLGLRAPAPAKPLPRCRLLGMGALFTVSSTSALFSLTRLPVSTYTVVLYTYPALVALLSLWFGERLSGWGWLALGMTLIGLLFTVPDFGTGLQGSDLGGIALGLLNASAYAVYIVLSGRLLRGQTALARASAWSITGSGLAMAALVVVRGLAVPAGPAGWANVLALVGFSTLLPIFTFYAGMHRIGAARAAILSTLEPLLSVILAVLIRHEVLSPEQVFGGALILFSVILLQTRQVQPVNIEVAPSGS